MLSLIERPLSLRESVVAVALLFAAGAGRRSLTDIDLPRPVHVPAR